MSEDIDIVEVEDDIVMCKDCRNLYYLGQVECTTFQGRPTWVCNSCVSKNKLSLSKTKE